MFHEIQSDYPASNERRERHRFGLNAPVTVIAGSSELTGFTRDLSNRGVYFFLDLPENVTLDGDLEFLVELPPEITLSTCCLIRCQGRVVRTDGPTREMTGIAAEIVQYSIQREAA
jgi:hypothetical protein